jgi:hypothetical protein
MKKRISGNSDTHLMMRKAKAILLVLLSSALLATILLVVFYRPAAYLAGLPIPALFFGFLFVSYLDKRATARNLRLGQQTAISSAEIDMDIHYAGIYTSLVLTVLMAISAIVMAATMVDNWSIVGASAAFILLLSIFYVVPYIPFFIADAEEDEREKLVTESEEKTQIPVKE